MLDGATAAARAATLAPDAYTVTLLSRNLGEGGYTSYPYQAMEQPAEQEELLLSGAVVGERWKIFEMFSLGAAVVPKELDQISDGVAKWTIKSLKREFNGQIYRCRALLAVGA